MNLADIAIRRPIFITCLVILMMALGYLSFFKLPVDLFPNISFPVVTVTTSYSGTGPKEMETLISKVLEEEISTLPGINSLTSTSQEGQSTIIAEFTLETDVKYAEQQIRDRVSSAKSKLPRDIKEPVIRRIDPADQPILMLTLTANLPEAELYELADITIKPKLEQISHVGLVEIAGGRKRELQIELNRSALKSHELSASRIVTAIAATGQNIPVGKIERENLEIVIRTLGEFHSLEDINNTVVNFVGNDVPIKISQIASVKDGLEDEKNRTYLNGKKSILISVYRQSGTNTISVVKDLKKRISKLNKELGAQTHIAHIDIVRDGSRPININVEDVKESILLGIVLTILVVYLFLGNGRSTFITSLALPNSLIGAFMLMAMAGFSINVMTLLALSLSVGLLIDDAIVVRENIFRHLEMGKSPKEAALIGTKEVTLAVIATSCTVLAVFGPIAFLQGVVGQFFKEFGLTICFAMVISLFDALTIAPMLSAYFAGRPHQETESKGLWHYTGRALVRLFERLQDRIDALYAKALHFSVRKPLTIIIGSILIFVFSIMATKHVPKTFLPPQDFGEFMVSLEMPPGTSLEAMNGVAEKVDALIRQHKEVLSSVMVVGNAKGVSNTTDIFINLVDSKSRSMNTSQVKELLRNELKTYAFAKPLVKDIDMVSGGQRPFNLNIIGNDLDELQQIASQMQEKLKHHPALLDVATSYTPGKPEYQVVLNPLRAATLGISNNLLGNELRIQTEGNVPAVYRESGEEYDIRVRLDQSQKDLKENFGSIFVPNMNGALIRLSDVAHLVETTGPMTITRQDRGRYIQISADIAPHGPGMGGAMQDIRKIFETEIKLPPGVKYKFVGQAESFEELGKNMAIAAMLAVLFIYLVLSSLYESFVTPFTIMLVLPLAACGAFFALFITGQSLDLFSMIGLIMLLGIATKNSILLVDYANQKVQEGFSFNAAILEAGKTRLRPILMTTVALIAGMTPIAIGLNEASKQRTSMGIAIIGGLISSTLLTLVVVPATYSYIERFRLWSGTKLKKIFAPKH